MPSMWGGACLQTGARFATIDPIFPGRMSAVGSVKADPRAALRKDQGTQYLSDNLENRLRYLRISPSRPSDNGSPRPYSVGQPNKFFPKNGCATLLFIDFV
jgi:hypothetical protein